MIEIQKFWIKISQKLNIPADWKLFRAFFVRFPGYISDISADSTIMKSFFQNHFEKHYFETEMSENDLEPEKSNESVESLI